MLIKDLEKQYYKTYNRNCSLCNKNIVIEEIRENKIIVSITKRKTILFAHKSCLVKVGDK